MIFRDVYRSLSKLLAARGKPVAPFPVTPTVTIALKYEGRTDGGPFTLTLGQGRTFCVTGIRPGPLRIWLRYTDPQLRARPRAFFARIHGAGVTANHTNRIGDRLFLGGGFERWGCFNKLIDIEAAEGADRFTISFRSKIDRFVNIDGISILTGDKIASVSEPHSAAAPVNLDDFRKCSGPALATARNLLLAEIDLNVIDGSSIWLSSMATILAERGPTLLLSRKSLRTDVVTANIRGRDALTVIEPHHVFPGRETLSRDEMIAAARRIDEEAPLLDNVVVRGLSLAAALLEDRRFHGRVDAYLTDFYSHAGDWRLIGDEQRSKVELVARQARRLLAQTEQIADELRAVSGVDPSCVSLPPPVPLIERRSGARRARGGPLRIGYSGKIATSWGLIQLFDWVEALRREGREIELTIIGDKLGGVADEAAKDALDAEFRRRLGETGATHHKALTRDETLTVMSEMDISWCWRPGHFEDSTLELSSKLVEGVANGFACLAYPSAINREALGEDYPFFVRTLEDFKRLMGAELPALPAETVERVRRRHDIRAISAAYRAALPPPPAREAPRICFSGHDFKFIDPYISDLRRRGVSVTRDVWEWGRPVDLERSRVMQADSDVIFAEWGLANAAWQSKTLPARKRLVVRIHLQEVNPLAARFGREIVADAVERFIFVSGRVRDTAVEMFGWPVDKTVVVPNFVLDEEFDAPPPMLDGPVRLGLVGIIPQRKRLDRALDLLRSLAGRGHPAELHIKGPRPETLPFMHAPGRAVELDYYKEQYSRIDTDPLIMGQVFFHPWGNDVATFYKRIDHILSPSDFESFHYALADGVLSRRHPVIWDWEEAAEIYTEDWVVRSAEEAADRILEFRSRPTETRAAQLERNRALVTGRYGAASVFTALDEAIKVT